MSTNLPHPQPCSGASVGLLEDKTRAALEDPGRYMLGQGMENSYLQKENMTISDTRAKYSLFQC
jgi:hypothetical protein